MNISFAKINIVDLPYTLVVVGYAFIGRVEGRYKDEFMLMIGKEDKNVLSWNFHFTKQTGALSEKLIQIFSDIIDNSDYDTAIKKLLALEGNNCSV